MDSVTFERDTRTVGMCYGADEQGVPRLVTQASLNEVVSGWPVTRATPENVQTLLAAARTTITTSLVAYELLSCGVLVSLQAVETALRERLIAAGSSDCNKNGRRLGWDALVARMVSRDLIERDSDEGELLDLGRQLRNQLAHPKQHMLAPYAASLPLIETSHRLVAHIFPD